MQPENVLLQKTGHVKLTDFDLSYMGGTVNPKVTFNPSVIKRKVKVRLRAPSPSAVLCTHLLHWCLHQQAAHALQDMHSCGQTFRAGGAVLQPSCP